MHARIACALNTSQSLNRNHELEPLPSHHQLHRPNTNMDSRNPFSKGFKRLKRKLAGSSRKRDGRSGSENVQDGREADIEGGEASQWNSRLHLEVEDVVESGPSREGNDVDGEEVGRVDPPAFIHSREPNSM
jgi:hypothetical protein